MAVLEQFFVGRDVERACVAHLKFHVSLVVSLLLLLPLWPLLLLLAPLLLLFMLLAKQCFH